MNKDNELPCIIGFDEMFDDGIFCGETSYTMPMEDEEVRNLMQEIISSN